METYQIPSAASTLFCPAANLTFTLAATSGILSVGPAKSSSRQGWAVHVIPDLATGAWQESARLFKGGAFVSARGNGFEVGATIREDIASQFFVLGKARDLKLKFEVYPVQYVYFTVNFRADRRS